MRPRWEWTSTGVEVVGFGMQMLARAITLAGVLNLWRVGTSEAKVVERVGALKFLERSLVAVVALEVVELLMRGFEVEGVCKDPHVVERREQGHGTQSVGECELVALLYDYVFGGLSIALLVWLVRVLHTTRRAEEGILAPFAEELTTGVGDGGDIENPVASGEVELELGGDVDGDGSSGDDDGDESS
jgi:hypothetical protein